jgi:hypothetical protein
MYSWRAFAAVFVSLAVASAGWGQTALTEVVKPGDCFRYEVGMKLTGEMRFRKDAGTFPVKLVASATHAYPERVLSASGAIVQKSARVYETAKVSIVRGTDRSDTSLRAGRKLIVAEWLKGQHLVYSPAGALMRQELDLVNDQFDTLALAGILPGKAVNVGDTWKLPNMEAQALCGLEGMTEQKIEGKFEKVVGNDATISLAGTASGVEQGALVKATISATALFDVKAQRITKLEWKQKSDRDQGPVSPASIMEIEIVVGRKVIEMPAELNDVALVAVPRDGAPVGPMLNLEYRDPKGRFNLVHTRDWHLTAFTGDQSVLRLLDRGDYVAQVTVTPWTKAKKGEHLTPEQFKKAINETSGWKPEKELQAGEIPATDGRYAYRFSAQGQLDDVPVMQNFFLIAAPTGEQVVLTFTLPPKMADKLGARDMSMAASIEVPGVEEKK